MKKIVSFMLMSAFIFILCSCSQNFEIDYEMGKDPFSMDFEGYEFVIMQPDLVEAGKERVSYMNSDEIKRRIEVSKIKRRTYGVKKY